MPTYTDVFSGRSRYSLVYVTTEGTIDINNNRSICSWSSRIDETTENGTWSNAAATWSAAVNGSTVGSGSKTYDFRSTNSVALGSGSVWVTHNADGTKTVAVSAAVGGGTAIGSASVSGSWAMSTIPRASQPTMSASSVDAGQSITILTHRASSSFTHTITYSVAGQTGTIATKTTVADVPWTPPLSLVQAITTATSATCTITVETFSGSTSLGKKSTSFSLKVPASIVPGFTTVTHSEATPGVATNVGAYVRGVSSLNLAVTGAAGAEGSTIKSYKIEVDGQTINAASGTTTPINASGTVPIKATVTDSRGRTATKTVNATFLDYGPPKFVTTPTAQRSLSTGAPNEQGTYLRVNINASVQSLLVSSVQKNALRYVVKVRPAAGGSWTTKSDVTTTGIAFNNYVNIGTYSITDAYDVLVQIIDDFSTSEIIIKVPVAKVFMHWDASLGVGIGKYRENGALDVAGDIFLSGTLTTPGEVTGNTGRFTSGGDASLTSTDHAIQAGPTDGLNIIIDGNEIMGRNNGAAGDLNIQIEGGNVNIGKTGGERVLIKPRVDNPFLPWAVASGRTSVSASFPVVALPSGRFTQGPNIVAQIYSGAGADIGVGVMVTNATTTSFQMRHTATSGNRECNWIAIQMSSGAASG